MPITPLPAAPSRADPATFATRADAHMAALPLFVTQANALETNVNARESLCTSAAVVAQAALDAGLANAASNAATASAASNAAQAAWTAALAANPDLNPGLRMNPSRLTQNETIPGGYNAYSAGPLEIADGTTITLNENARWAII